jgi:peptidase C39-like protein
VTDLFVAFAGLDVRTVRDAVPPTVLCALEPDGMPARDGADHVLELGPWVSRTPTCHVLPSVALLTSRPYSVRFEIAGRRGATWTRWVATATLGESGFIEEPSAEDGLTAEIDEVRATPPVDAVRVRVRLRGAPDLLTDTPWLATVSLWDGTIGSPPAPAATRIRLRVPSRTQFAEPEPVRMRICSPTSLGMALEYFGHAVPTMDLAHAVFHRATDRYGVWPAAVCAAAARGLPGFLLRFSDWDAVAWCLKRGSPIVASIRFGEGELTNAPLPGTSGHLVVITGMDGSDVLVNDPAAPAAASVPRRYRRDEFSRAWLEGSGVGYVFFRAR